MHRVFKLQLSLIQPISLIAFPSHFFFADIYIKRCSIFQLPFRMNVPCNEKHGSESVFSEIHQKGGINGDKWETGEKRIVLQSELMPIWKRLSWGRRCKTFGNENYNYFKSWQKFYQIVAISLKGALVIIYIRPLGRKTYQ